MAPKKAKKGKKGGADGFADDDAPDLELGDIPAAQSAPKPKAAAKKKKSKKALQAGDWSDDDAELQPLAQDHDDDEEPPASSRKSAKASAAFALLQASPSSSQIILCGLQLTRSLHSEYIGTWPWPLPALSVLHVLPCRRRRKQQAERRMVRRRRRPSLAHGEGQKPTFSKAACVHSRRTLCKPSRMASRSMQRSRR